jgi:ATP-dependent exoDNAse (exonuclease V) beta subunit
VIANYFEPFKKHEIANKLVTTSPKYMGMDPSNLIANWDAARDYGTKVHNEIELFLNEDIKPEEIESFAAIEWLKKYETNPEIKIYSEVIVYSKELKIAGSIDILIHDQLNNCYEIIDWKTSKSIDKSSFGGKMGTHSITNHLMDCKYVHYSIQLSFYRYLLEKFYGLKIQNQLIAHLKGNSCTMHTANYYQKEVLNIISDHNNK